MDASTLFWIVWVIVLIFGGYRHRMTPVGPGAGGDLLVLILIGILGWKTFGPILK